MTFAPKTWQVGEVVTAAMLNTEIRDQLNSMFGAWTTYTPAFGSTGTAPAVGNGTLTGQYMKIGRTVILSITFTVGSTTTFGSGNLNFSLPVTGASASNGVALNASASRTGTQNFVMGAIPLTNNATTTATMWFASPSTTGDWDAWTTSTPWTLAAGDIVRVWGIYQSAT
ncbi:hypothetical protein ACJ6WF_16140 [Streptomyces sp. MMS24-I2-30]|uniref:hypothetical protein n=1 Tax=Streptomyces sp. MMS24-I2-30 TaxID=3351564 RepID=UPI0038968D5A